MLLKRYLNLVFLINLFRDGIQARNTMPVPVPVPVAVGKLEKPIVVGK
jgi:hypothetical protein